MTPEEQAAGRAALERLKRFSGGEILATVYPLPPVKLDALRDDLRLVLGALRRRADA